MCDRLDVAEIRSHCVKSIATGVSLCAIRTTGRACVVDVAADCRDGCGLVRAVWSRRRGACRLIRSTACTAISRGVARRRWRGRRFWRVSRVLAASATPASTPRVVVIIDVVIIVVIIIVVFVFIAAWGWTWRGLWLGRLRPVAFPSTS